MASIDHLQLRLRAHLRINYWLCINRRRAHSVSSMTQSGKSWNNRWVAIELFHDEFNEVDLCAPDLSQDYQQGNFQSALILITCTLICVSNKLCRYVSNGPFGQQL